LERDRISHEGFFLFGVRVEIQLFAGWVSIVKVYVDVVGVPLLLGERAEERSIL
jgi:hypothetical protein